MALDSQTLQSAVWATARESPPGPVPQRDSLGHHPFHSSGNRWEDTGPHSPFEVHGLHVQKENGKGIEDESCSYALLSGLQSDCRKIDRFFGRGVFL